MPQQSHVDLTSTSVHLQNLVPMVITLSQIDPVDFDRLDKNALRVYGVKVTPYQGIDAALADADCQMVAALAWRGLLISTELIRAAGIPIFDPGDISSVERLVENRWRVRFCMPRVDYIDKSCYRDAYGYAMATVSALSLSSLHPAEQQTLWDKANSLIASLRRRVGSGKSTIWILEVAHRLGIPYLGLGGSIYQLGWGSQSRKIDRSATDRDAAIGLRLTHNKHWTVDALRMAGLPAPIHQVVGSTSSCIHSAQDLGWPLVIKPVDGDRGEGVTVGVHDESQLIAAYNRAKGQSKRRQVIVEREVQGVCHRLFVAQGRLLYGVKRLPISVTGNGVHTVDQLIDAANDVQQARPPWRRSELYPRDAGAKTVL